MVLQMANTAGAARPGLLRLLWEELQDDQIRLRASALAFQTLASWLPLMAITLAVLSSPAFETQRERILDRLATALVPDSALPAPIVEFGPSLLPDLSLPGEEPDARQEAQDQLKAKFRATVDLLSRNLAEISTLSFLVLLGVVGLLYRTAEEALNVIWKVRAGRSLFMRLAIVTALVFWGPVFFFISLALMEKLSFSPLLGAYLLPVLLTAAAFTAFYMVMPNARVDFRCALIAGLSAALVWELGKAGFLVYVSCAVRWSKVYGSLGIVPIVFAWVYLSWVVVLLGSELAYVLQHRGAVEGRWAAARRSAGRGGGGEGASADESAQIPALALAAAIETARRVRAGEARGGVKLSDLAAALGAETAQLSRAVERLAAGGMLVRVADAQDAQATDPRFLLADDPARLRLDSLWRVCRGAEAQVGGGPSWEQAAKILARVQDAGAAPLASLTLAELLPPQQAASEGGATSGPTASTSS